MEIKKTEKASLENKKLLFVEIGLVVSLAITLFAFEWTSTETETALLEDTTEVLIEEEIISTQMETPPPPPEAPKIPVLSDQIDIDPEIPVAPGEEHWLLDTSLDEVYWPCSHLHSKLLLYAVTQANMGISRHKLSAMTRLGSSPDSARNSLCFSSPPGSSM